MEVMNSCGVGISITGGVAETEDDIWWLPVLPLYIMQMTFIPTHSDDVYRVRAAVPITSFY